MRKTKNLTLREMVQVITQYDVLHRPLGGELDGECDNGKRVIFIDETISYQEMMKTVIHECIHAKYALQGIKDDSEDYVVDATNRVYRRLFDGKK